MDPPGSGLCSAFSCTEPSSFVTGDKYSTLLLVSEPTTFSSKLSHCPILHVFMSQAATNMHNMSYFP